MAETRLLPTSTFATLLVIGVLVVLFAGDPVFEAIAWLLAQVALRVLDFIALGIL